MTTPSVSSSTLPSSPSSPSSSLSILSSSSSSLYSLLSSFIIVTVLLLASIGTCYVDAQAIVFSYYTCGMQLTGAANGNYFNSSTNVLGNLWDGSSPGNDYLNSPALNGGSYSDRGYPQCYGRATTNNCLDQFATSPAYPLQTYATNGGLPFNKGSASPEIAIIVSGNNRIFKMKFFPNVDDFALLQIQDSFASATGITEFGAIGTAFQVEINGMVSSVAHRYGYTTSTVCALNASSTCATVGSTLCTIVPYHTLIITLAQGVIQSVAFDQDCSLCSSDHCINGNCAVDINTCYNSTALLPAGQTQSVDCTFKVYASWSGTDSGGLYLSSSGRRLSQFRLWSINAAYTQASNFNLDNLPVVPAAGSGTVV